MLGLALLAACTVGPNYKKPAEPTPAGFSESAGAAPVGASTQAELAQWWKEFNDPVLEQLIGRALAANLDLEAAASRVREARFEAKIAAAGEWPTINALGNAVNLRQLKSLSQSPSAPSGAGFQAPKQVNLFAAGFDASWEVDLFGGVRRQIEEARANREAAEWARRDAEVTLTAEVASDYFALRETEARIQVGEDELARQQDIGKLVASRRQAGFVTNFDVNQQTGATATAAAQLHQLEGEGRAQVHALEILLGEPPETLEPELAGAGPFAATPPSLPTGLPSTLLERRPDLREAERRLAAATAEIGVQTANLYPKVNLIPDVGYTDISIPSLFTAQSLSFAALSSLTWPIFTAGKTQAAISAAKEKAVQAELAYRSAVLGAFRDVEDALARYRSEEARRAQLEQAVAATTGSLAIARDQYRTGLVTYLNVYTAENAELNARDQLTQSNAQATQDLVSLYKALGGGWTEGEAADRATTPPAGLR